MAAIAIAALIVVMLEAAAALGATLALVLAVDVSASVTADSYLLQHEGIARAFADSRLVEAIAGASGGIEVLVGAEGFVDMPTSRKWGYMFKTRSPRATGRSTWACAEIFIAASAATTTR